jgi:predicted nucleic-acid-binding Zn-ribbon protein
MLYLWDLPFVTIFLNQNKLGTEGTNRKCGYSKIYKKQKNSLVRSRDADG